MENTFVIWFTKQLGVIKHGDVSSYFSNLSLPSVLSDPWWNGIVLYWFIKYKNNFKILLKKKRLVYTQHGKTINLLMVAIKRQKQKQSF